MSDCYYLHEGLCSLLAAEGVEETQCKFAYKKEQEDMLFHCNATDDDLVEFDEEQEQQDEWTQTEVIHCPEKNCKGMLLTSPFKHELKCSDCNKYYMQNNELIEVKND